MNLKTAATTILGLLLLSVSKAVPIGFDADTAACAGGFTASKGWCVKVSSTELTFEKAVQFCRTAGVPAPSVHSQEDVDFWGTIINKLRVLNSHFWLDATCPAQGQLYKWLDGTLTDFQGRNGELASCDLNEGLHMHADGGLIRFAPDVTAPALCAYKAPQSAPAASTPAAPPVDSRTTRAQQPAIVDVSTAAPTTTPPPPSTAAPTTTVETTPTVAPTDATVDYCSCDPNSIYLDVAFVVDASADMTEAIVNDVSATIQSLLFGLTHGTEFFQTNVAVVAYAESVKTVKQFGDIRSVMDILDFDVPYLGGNATKMRDAIKTATSMLSKSSRNYTRGAVFLISKSFDQLDAVNIFAAAQEFKDNSGVFISIDYTNGGYVKGLEAIASPGYYINDAASPNSLVPDMLYALCDANCFCPKGQTPYNVPNENGRSLPMGCYHVADSSAVYVAAEPNCQKQHGFVATIHDDAKNYFMMSIFPPKTPFWIGLKLVQGAYEWADGSVDQTSNWAPGNPIAGKDCVYAQQTTGFNSMWYSAPCADPLKNTLMYSCQLRPCSSEYNCYTN